MKTLIATIVMLSAFTLAQAQDSALSPSPSPSPVTSPTPEKELLTLTPQRLQKLIKDDRENGKDDLINDAFSQALGLPKGHFIGRQVGAVLGSSKIIFFIPSNAVGYLFAVVTADGIFVFYVDKSLNLISAANKRTGKGVVAVSDQDWAKHTLAVVLDRWSQVVDNEKAKNAEPPHK